MALQYPLINCRSAFIFENITMNILLNALNLPDLHIFTHNLCGH